MTYGELIALIKDKNPPDKLRTKHEGKIIVSYPCLSFLHPSDKEPLVNSHHLFRETDREDCWCFNPDCHHEKSSYQQ